MTTLRKKSPRAPSLALDDAIEKALLVYNNEHRHAAPQDAVAQHVGYKSANNGSALSTLASLKYYGLIERVKDGMLAVTQEVEAYKFAPKDEMRRSLIVKWLTTPPLFADLLDQYAGKLPSEATLKYDLIKRGFNPAGADACVSVFTRSVEYAKYYDLHAKSEDSGTETAAAASRLEDAQDEVVEKPSEPMEWSRSLSNAVLHTAAQLPGVTQTLPESDRIPVRLKGGRRAWLEIPVPFYEADKQLLMAQIELLITNDGDEA